MTHQRPLSIVEYTDTHAKAFYDINAQWIEAMFVLEKHDRDVLSNPRARILDPGGVILLVEAEGLGIVGACALMKTNEGVFELTKMGVLEKARGLKVGEFLLQAMIARAIALPVQTLYLLTHHSCEAAIHLYEKNGFVHDAAIMQAHGATYARCDVAMSYPLPRN